MKDAQLKPGRGSMDGHRHTQCDDKDSLCHGPVIVTSAYP